MEFRSTSIAGVVELRLDVRGDERGQFKRHYCEREFAEAGLAVRWVQMNHSITRGAGTVRGLHYQLPPAAEDKLVSCTYGRVLDVAVDLRKDSPTFLDWVAVELNQSSALYIPKGCAHGFQTLTEEAHLVYLHSEFYAPELEAGVRIDDPAIGIDWPLPISIQSGRDSGFALLDDSFEGIEP